MKNLKKTVLIVSLFMLFSNVNAQEWTVQNNTNVFGDPIGTTYVTNSISDVYIKIINFKNRKRVSLSLLSSSATIYHHAYGNGILKIKVNEVVYSFYLVSSYLSSRSSKSFIKILTSTTEPIEVYISDHLSSYNFTLRGITNPNVITWLNN